MIITDNSDAQAVQFDNLMKKVNLELNKESKKNENYFLGRGGVLLEKDVFDKMVDLAEGTAFDGAIFLLSGKSFPDIVASECYGVEVKTTLGNHWTSIGNSVLESTRVKTVDRIWILFGKLTNPVEFKCKRYEDCLVDVSVTHYPRYKIDMNLMEGETIFDKMNISYDSLRNSENPVTPIAKYYKSQTKPGEFLWWAQNGEITPTPPIVKILSSLSKFERTLCIIEGYILFPEVIQKNSNKKYNNFVEWMLIKKSIVSSSTRDMFSAGGREDVTFGDVTFKDVPRTLIKLGKYIPEIKEILEKSPISLLESNWRLRITDNPFETWKRLILKYARDLYEYSDKFFKHVFEYTENGDQKKIKRILSEFESMTYYEEEIVDY